MSGRLTFALTVIGTIALPIAANTLIYAIVRGVLLEPLPFPQSERLVRVEQRRASGVTGVAALARRRDDDRRAGRTRRRQRQRGYRHRHA